MTAGNNLEFVKTFPSLMKKMKGDQRGAHIRRLFGGRGWGSNGGKLKVQQRRWKSEKGLEGLGLIILAP